MSDQIAKTELRDTINYLSGGRTEDGIYNKALRDLAKRLDVNLGPSELEIEGYIWQYGEYAITMDADGGFSIPLREELTNSFGRSWAGTKVKLKITEIMDED